MSPRTADPAVAQALVEAGARLIAAHEPLSTRRLAGEVGVSTSAVYTHFGSMDEVRRAIRRVGFERLAEHLASVEPTADPVADLAKQGWAYCRNAIANPHMYRVMFMESPVDDKDAEVGLYTYMMLVDAVQRCIDAGRFSPGDAAEIGLRFWTTAHGAASLHIAGMLSEEDVHRIVQQSGRAHFAALGDDDESVEASMRRAGRWIAQRS